MVNPRPLVLLDRDGVIVVPHFREGRSFAPRRLEDFRIYPEAHDALASLRERGFGIAVVTNQPDIGNELVERKVVDAMHEMLLAELPMIEHIEICPHGHTENCTCRKPAPGMLLDSAKALDGDLKRSFMVGDRASDVAAGAAAGCRTVYIDRGYTKENCPLAPDHICIGIAQAGHWILSHGPILAKKAG